MNEEKRIIAQKKFIEKSINKYGKNKFDFSKVYYINRSTEVLIHCNKHNLDFYVKPSVFLDKETKYGCPECRKEAIKVSKIITAEEFIKRSKEKFPGKFDYSETIYINMDTPVILICKKHGRIIQIPKVHLNSVHGCPICANESVKISKSEFIKLAIEKYGDKFDFSKMKFVNMTTPVTIICPIHGEFEITPTRFISKSTIYGCPKCSFELSEKRSITSLDELIKLSESIHGKGRYDFSKAVYKDMSTKICIICHEIDPITGKEHGEFWIEPRYFITNRKGCPKCYNKKKRVWTTKDFIEKAKIIHKDKYDYSKTDLEHRRDDGKVCIICPTHGEFWINPLKHINSGQGCKECYEEIRGNSQKFTTDTFIKRIEEIYGKNTFDFSKTIYTSLTDEVTLICPIHGEFTRLASSLLYKNAGCPMCSLEKHISKGEKFIENFLNKNFIHSTFQFKLENIEGRKSTYVYIDFSLEYNDQIFYIEYNGMQHYKEITKFHKSHKDFLDQKRRDDNVKQYCIENGIVFIEIPYTYKTQKDIDDLLTEIILNGNLDFKINIPERE